MAFLAQNMAIFSKNIAKNAVNHNVFEQETDLPGTLKPGGMFQSFGRDSAVSTEGFLYYLASLCK